MIHSALLTLWVTTDCNLHCRYCYAGGGDGAEYMNWHVARRAIDIMTDLFGSFTIQFAGGEPLLNMDLVERVVHYTKDKGIVCQLQTNATLIDAELAQSLKRLKINVGVSLDGLPDVNDSLRPFPDGRGSTSAVITGLESLREAGIRVGLTCVLSAENVTGLPGLVELAGYLGNVEGIAFDILRPVGRAKECSVKQADYIMAVLYVKAALKRADELALMGARRVKFREAEKMRYCLSKGLKRQYRCHFNAGKLLLVVPDGRAYPCPSLVSYHEFYLGNVLEPAFACGLKADLWRCSRLISLPNQCLQCNDIRLCAGPCPAQTYAQRLYDTKPTECYVKKAFLSYIRREETISYASAD